MPATFRSGPKCLSEPLLRPLLLLSPSCQQIDIALELNCKLLQVYCRADQCRSIFRCVSDDVPNEAKANPMACLNPFEDFAFAFEFKESELLS